MLNTDYLSSPLISVATSQIESVPVAIVNSSLLVTGNSLTASMISDMMKEMPPLISENDLHVSQVCAAFFCCADISVLIDVYK